METIRKKNEGWTTYQVRKIAGISIRRVNQVFGTYLKTGNMPEIGKMMGRPQRQITAHEAYIVKESYQKYRVSASTLEKLIERDYSIHLPHRYIHTLLVNLVFCQDKI